jgi:enoyl-CoA hydratase/carnithine racemase
MGLITQVVPRGEGLNAAKDLARRLAKNPALPMTLIKDAVLRGCQLPLDQGLAIEADNFAQAFDKSGWNKS